jgi:aspartate aminotransferase
MSISQLARNVAESPTLRLNEEARMLRQKGEPVIHLGIGEPQNKAPITALLSSSAKLTSGDIKYAPPDGLPSLKKAIVRYMEEIYDKVVEPENIIISEGAKQSIYNTVFTLCDHNDEVIILAPYWVSYPEIVKMCYGIPVIVTPEDGGFHPRMEDIEEVVGSYTKAIIVNSPNNPSGVMYSEAFIAELVDFCERKDIYIIMDDIYHRLIFDSKKPISAYRFTNKDIENSRIVVVNGVSKAYGMTGFRIGWTVAPRKVVEVMTNVQAQITSHASIISQAAAEGALLGLQSVIESLRLTIQNNRDVMMEELGTFSGIHVQKPDGTFYCFPDFRAYNSNSVELANFILKKALVVTVPGTEFGMEGFIRLSYAGSVSDITEGIERIKWALDPEAPNDIYIGDRKLIRDWL